MRPRAQLDMMPCNRKPSSQNDSPKHSFFTKPTPTNSPTNSPSSARRKKSSPSSSPSIKSSPNDSPSKSPTTSPKANRHSFIPPLVLSAEPNELKSKPEDKEPKLSSLSDEVYCLLVKRNLKEIQRHLQGTLFYKDQSLSSLMNHLTWLKTNHEQAKENLKKPRNNNFKLTLLKFEMVNKGNKDIEKTEQEIARIRADIQSLNKEIKETKSYKIASL